MKRFLLISLGTLFIASSGVLLGSSYASAASVYDDLYRPTDKLEVKRLSDTSNPVPCTETHDMTTELGGFISDFDNWDTRIPIEDRQLMYDRWQQKQAWAIGNMQSPPVGYERAQQYIYYHFSLEETASLYWLTTGVNVTDSYSLMVIFARTFGGSSCDLVVRPATGIGDRSISENQAHLKVDNFLAYNYTVNLPEDYEGIIPPSSYTPSQVYTPRVSYTVGDNSTRRLTVINLDQNIKLPAGMDEVTGEVTPKLHIKLYNSDDELIEEEDEKWQAWGTILPDLGEYKLVVSYAHPGVPFLPFFGVELKTVTFTFNYTGGVIIGSVDSKECTNVSGDINCAVTEVNLFEECITMTAPFIDFPACVRNVGTFVNLLTFQVTGFNNRDWSLSGGCHQLTHLGGWLNLDNQYVCPSFPANVRNIITPFVSFFLGAITVGFLMRAGDNNK